MVLPFFSCCIFLVHGVNRRRELITLLLIVSPCWCRHTCKETTHIYCTCLSFLEQIEHSHNATFQWNSQIYEVNIIYAIIDCVCRGFPKYMYCIVGQSLTCPFAYRNKARTGLDQRSQNTKGGLTDLEYVYRGGEVFGWQVVLLFWDCIKNFEKRSQIDSGGMS